MAATYPRWKTIATTSSSDSSTLPCCFFFSTSPSPRTKRGRFATFSSLLLNPHEYHLGPAKKKKSVEIGRPHQQTVSIIHDKCISKAKIKAKFDWKKSIQKGAKSRPLWRRVLFASKKMKSIILLNVVTIVYASNIAVVKEVETIMDPAAFSAVRFAVSAIPFLPFVFRARGDVQTRNAGLELGLWISLGYLAEALGLLTSEAGRASFFRSLQTWFGVLMSVLGVAMLECSGSPPNVGDLLNFLSAIFFGIHILRTEQLSRSTKKENFLPLLGYEVCVVALLSTFWYVIGGWFDGIQDSDQASWTWAVLWDSMVAFPWIPALYTGVFSTGLCLWLEIGAMRDVSATETAIIYGLEPLWGAGFAWFLLGERWGTTGWIGAALLLGGSLTVQMFGSSSSSESIGVEDGDKEVDILVSEKQKLQTGLSASPVVIISSRKDVIDMLKK
ncbi:hypothetical protein CK203_004270 [Vitis vinifera]|uniref:EamA domain-containing protein n=1 Tax=Vitis vinifera TaxID=29760 RepID=A0A438K9V0_VITVI|nr:hypothetical protein CK203_004270 [Vitis vinifera]